jgi:hypothetical protein
MEGEERRVAWPGRRPREACAGIGHVDCAGLEANFLVFIDLDYYESQWSDAFMALNIARGDIFLSVSTACQKHIVVVNITDYYDLIGSWLQCAIEIDVHITN